MSWSVQAIETLRRMWEAGDTAPTIAAKLGISRNAVLGKAHRLKLARRERGRPDRRPIVKHPERPIRNRLDKFADLIKDDMPVPVAALRMGISPERGNVYMQRLRQRYGD